MTNPSRKKSGSGSTKVRGGIQSASRRRRASARSASGPRRDVERAGHRNNFKHQISAILGFRLLQSDPPLPAGLPRNLVRPVTNPFDMSKITSFAPELADTHLGYIRKNLQSHSPQMLEVLASVKVEPTYNGLPEKLSMVVNDLSSDPPTHLLAVYASHLPPGAKRHATLFPAHNIILAAHCANLPTLPPSDVVPPKTLGSTVIAPIVPLCLPAPEVFSPLSHFLYTKRVDRLLASLLSASVPGALYRDDPTSDAVLSVLRQFSCWLAVKHSKDTLYAYAMRINGLWRNTCALGIDDAKLWCALDVAWEVILHALGYADVLLAMFH